MSHDEEERVESYLDKQEAKKAKRCTRNMNHYEGEPIPDVEYEQALEEALRKNTWLTKRGWPTEESIDNGGVASPFIKDYEVQKGDPNWPTEERIDNIAQNGATGEHYLDKYGYTRALREEKTHIDVYDVLDAFPTNCPPVDHAIKKLLCTGSRGVKDWETDLQEAIDSLEQAKKYPPLPF